MVRTELQKWMVTISISMSRFMAYKADFFLTLLAPSLVFILINYNVWRSLYSNRNGATIDGISMEQMLHYQCWAFIVTLIVRSHRSWNLAEDIRLGRITSFLLYPFEVWKFHASEFLGFQIIQIITVSIALTTMRLWGFLPELSPHAVLLGLLFSVLVSGLWFALEFLFGVTAFWLEETWVARVIFQLFAVFLSGAFIPLELFPAPLRAALSYTPFPLMTWIPASIFLGNPEIPLVRSFASLVVWMLIVSVLAAFTWRRGVKHYTAAGI
jgi:ABC-2 type transport system permease protein